MNQRPDLGLEALRGLRDTLGRMIDNLDESIRRRREEVLDSQGRMQSRYDTSRIEGSWEVDAQTRRRDGYAEMLAAVDARLAAVDNGTDDGAAVVAVRPYGATGSDAELYLLAPVGGISLSVNGMRVCTVSAASPLGRALSNRLPGDLVVVPTSAGERRLEVVTIA